MTRKLVLFSDGTGNSSAKAEKTNVWRLFEGLGQKSGDQIGYYDDGVGTSTNKYLAALGGAFGWGLKRNVIDLYKFVCRNYQPGDQIFGFGFSRGAYTMRMVVGLIASQGLVPYDTEEALNRKAASAFRAYRWANHWRWHHLALALRVLLGGFYWVRDRLTRDPYEPAANNRKLTVHFLGLWDTVAAYEMPVEEIKRAMDKWLWPMGFSSLALSPIVENAFHALSLDDERETFHPMLWDENAERDNVEASKVQAGRVTQVWFAGVHSNVGGGYSEDRLSLVAMDWIAEQAIAQGLSFNALAMQVLAQQKSPFGRLYDSRAGGGVLYRYAPRRIPGVPVVHSSVIHRMAEGGDAYAPISLPERIEILTPGGVVATLAQSQSLAASSDPEKSALGRAMGLIVSPTREELERVWDTVWWRRVAYYLTVCFVVLLVAYPWYAEAMSKALRFDEENAVSSGVVSSTVTALSAFVPGFLSAWLDSLRQFPLGFACVAGVLALCLYFGRLLGLRIRHRAFHAWHGVRKPAAFDEMARREAGVATALATLALVAASMVALAFMADWTRQAKSLWLFVASLLALLAALRARASERLKKVASNPASYEPPDGAVTLRIARAIRTSEGVQAFNRFFANWFVPAVFLGIMGLVGLVLANKALMEVRKSVEADCKGTPGLALRDEKLGAAREEFRTSSACWPSGLVLQKDARYRIRVEIGDDWFDAGHRADLGGFEADTAVHVFFSGLKQWWRANWFQPIARIGTIGNEEYALEPLAPFTHHAYLGAAKSGGRCEALADADARKAAVAYPTPADRRVMESEVTARSTGELFLYVNDAMFALGPGTKCIYSNNRGTAKVSVERVLPASVVSAK
jgi:uncharacterized protein (DUF2235 family)